MKRIEIEKPTATPTVTQGAPDAAWNEAWTQQLGRTAEIYGKLFAAMRDETAGFVQKRLEADMDIARCWGACRSMTDVLDLQQKWLRDAIEQYTQQGLKLTELCQKAVSEPVQTVAQAQPQTASQPGAERTKPAAEQSEAGVPRAA